MAGSFSSSSWHIDIMDSLDAFLFSVSSPILISHHSWFSRWHPVSSQSWWVLNFFWSANTDMSIYMNSLENIALIYPYFFNSAQHVLFILLGWFVRWEVSGCIAAILLSAASKICSKQHIASFCSSHLVFFLGVLLKSK